jgi:hypothetical protein
VTKLVSFVAEEASQEELCLVAAGKVRMPKVININQLLKIPNGKVSANEASPGAP